VKKTIQVRTKYVVLSGAMIGVLTLTAGACDDGGSSSGQDKENKQQAQSTNSLVTNQPIPHFNYSQLRQNLKEIETAEANGVQTTTFFFNQGVQDPIDSCPSIGAPIPTTDQLSNPQQTSDGHYNGNYGLTTIGQMDPTGVYTGDSTGTYVMCVGGNGKTYASYWEGYVKTVFANATWDKSTHSVKVLGDPSFKFTGKK
jgi:hypothetical protein